MQTLRLFYDVARCHSFSQAASMHSITQSAASQRISQLEKRLGVVLIDRSVRPLALTEAGQSFLRGCEGILDKYDKLAAEVALIKEDPVGTVRVAAIYSAGIDLLGQIVDRFHDEHQRINVEIQYTKPDDVYRLVKDGEADFGILAYPQSWRKLGIIPLREEIMAVVCSPRHPLAQLSEVTAEVLTAYNMVTFDTNLPVGKVLQRFLREHGSSPKIVSTFDNIDTIKNAVAVTDSISILPGRTVLQEARVGILSMVRLLPQMVRPMGVVYRRKHKSQGASFAPAVQQFVDYLLANAGPSSEAEREWIVGHEPSVV
ncbi:LysR family transcriptional regulator [Planctomycetota bacterium]|nr:LysR family transcriptional regulator [Planctomycetota bacterium]